MTLTVLIYLEVSFETKGVKIQVTVDVLPLRKKSGKTNGVKIQVKVVILALRKNTGKRKRRQILTGCIFPDFFLKVKTKTWT